MEATQTAIFCIAAALTVVDTTKRIDAIDDVEHAKRLWVPIECVPAMRTTLRGHEASPCKRLQHLGQIALRNKRRFGKLLRGLRYPGLLGESDHGSKGVFSGLRNGHESLSLS